MATPAASKGHLRHIHPPSEVVRVIDAILNVNPRFSPQQSR